MALFSALAATATATATATAQAQDQDQYPFPQLNTEKFCKDSVSKMSDKGEQSLELLKCLDQEHFIKKIAEPWWPFIESKMRRQILARHYKDGKFHTYATLVNYVEFAIGRACLEGRIKCENPPPPSRANPEDLSPL